MTTILPLAIIALAGALALISTGGVLYEVAVVHPAWPGRPDIIQPGRGGVSRRRFWIPAHVGFELALIATLVLTWVVDWVVDRPASAVRVWLLIALASHAAMRLWPPSISFRRRSRSNAPTRPRSVRTPPGPGPGAAACASRSMW